MLEAFSNFFVLETLKFYQDMFIYLSGLFALLGSLRAEEGGDLGQACNSLHTCLCWGAPGYSGAKDKHNWENSERSMNYKGFVLAVPEDLLPTEQVDNIRTERFVAQSHVSNQPTSSARALRKSPLNLPLNRD